VARATGHRPTLPQETLMEQATWNLEYATLLREDFARGGETTPVPYATASPRPVYRAGVGSCDLHATMRARPALVPGAAQVELRLGDIA
jgi:hypothetical protein